ncbi:MAG: flagellin lysine-N-methylase [Clostridia bacterium]|nr:flagellin lysine-N-methylase [Clostridia bacterium]
MKNTFPNYYKSFSCIADKCPDTCCAGWAVVADEESLKKYKNVSGAFGQKITDVISVDCDGDTVFTPVNNRCPFLLDSGLCEMYIELGHESLCCTCRQYPRHITYFGARSETGLSLSCPEAARIIMQSSEPITFETENTLDFPQPTDIEPELYFTLLDARKKAIDILQNRDFSINQRICAFLLFSQDIAPHIKHSGYKQIKNAINTDYFTKEKSAYSQRRANGAIKKYFSDFTNLEMLEPSWKDALLSAQDEDISCSAYETKSFEWEYEHLMVYFVFRYFMTAVFDKDLLTKAKFAAASFIIIRKLHACENAEKERRTQITQRFSKEVEHSADNMDYLHKSMKKSRFYSIQNLINLIWEK